MGFNLVKMWPDLATKACSKQKHSLFPQRYLVTICSFELNIVSIGCQMQLSCDDIQFEV